MLESKPDEPLFPPGIESQRALPAPPGKPSIAAYENWLDALQKLQFPISALHDPLLVEEFASSVLAVTKTWSTDFLDALDKLESVCDKYRELRARLLNLASDDDLLESDDLILDFGELRLIFAERNDPDPYLREVDWLKNLWNEYCQGRQKAKEVLEPRFKQIETVLCAFTSKHKLPPIALTIAEASGPSDHLGSYCQGAVELNLHLLASSITACRLVQTLYHELVHAEQDALILSCVADRVGLRSARATEEHLDRIEVVYRESLQLKDWPSFRPFIKDVLALRRGVELTLPEQWRAAYLIAAWHKGRCLIEQEGEILERLNNATALHGRLSSMTELSPVLKLIAETRQFKEAICDCQDLPSVVETLVEAARMNDWEPLGVRSSFIAREILIDIVRERIEHLQSLMDDNWGQYRLTHDENEAWLIGTQARLTAENQLSADRATDRGS